MPEHRQSPQDDHANISQQYQPRNPVERQPLEPGVAARSCQHAMDANQNAFLHVHEAFSQLGFEHDQRLRTAKNELHYVRQELEAARQGIRDRDGEIDRLRRSAGLQGVPQARFHYYAPRLTSQPTSRRAVAQTISGDFDAEQTVLGGVVAEEDTSDQDNVVSQKRGCCTARESLRCIHNGPRLSCAESHASTPSSPTASPSTGST